MASLGFEFIPADPATAKLAKSEDDGDETEEAVPVLADATPKKALPGPNKAKPKPNGGAKSKKDD
jgi:ATP-dependent Clp protease ATP-binding subunit ClpA